MKKVIIKSTPTRKQRFSSHGSLTKAGKVRRLHEREWREEVKKVRYGVEKKRRRKSKHKNPRVANSIRFKKLQYKEDQEMKRYV